MYAGDNTISNTYTGWLKTNRSQPDPITVFQSKNHEDDMDDNNDTTIHDTHIGDRSKINRLRDNTK